MIQTKPTTKTVDEYLQLPYTVEIHRDNSDGTVAYVARVVELPGCLTEADSFDELDAMIQDAMQAWLESALEDGIPVPEPRLDEQYSGKFVVRLPRSLHRQLATTAEQEGVSLNAFVSTTLAHAIGTNTSTTR